MTAYKIAVLSNANSPHTIKIANSLIENNVNVIVISQKDHRDTQHLLKCKTIYLKHGGNLGYYLNKYHLKSILKEENITVLNAHYASGYGTLCRKSGFHPSIISVWGSDVFEFPYQNKAKNKIIKKNLRYADCIFSTSECMVDEVKKLFGREDCIVTPFGVNISEFKPMKTAVRTEIFTIGFLKGTDETYGIDILLESISILKSEGVISKENFLLKICGGESRLEQINEKIFSLGIKEMIQIDGVLPHNEMAEYINSCDIICVPSLHESFGVVAIEAMACGKPVIASDAPGLRDVIINEKTGLIVPRGKPKELAESIKIFLNNKEYITNMGIYAREHVETNYDINENIKRFIAGYKSVKKY